MLVTLNNLCRERPGSHALRRFFCSELIARGSLSCRAVPLAPAGFRLKIISFGRARFCPCRFVFPISRRCTGFEQLQQPCRDRGDLFNGREECSFIRPGWLVEAADLPHELQRRCTNLRIVGRRIKIKKRFYIAAHGHDSTAAYSDTLALR